MITPGDWTLRIYQGRTLDVPITWSAGGAVTDLTGWDARLQVRQTFGSSVLLDLSVDNGGIVLGATEPNIRLLRDAGAIARLQPLEAGVYDLRLTGLDGVTFSLLRGAAQILPRVTP